MKSCWIDDRRLQRVVQRHEAFWQNTLKDGPILWLVVPDAHAAPELATPGTPDGAMTDIDYVIAAIDNYHARTHFAGDAIPIHNPWLGPDQFAGWLGGDLTFRPEDNTSWATPFVENWADHREFRIDPANKWWNLYLDLLKGPSRRGKTNGLPPSPTFIRASTRSAPCAARSACSKTFSRNPTKFGGGCAR